MRDKERDIMMSKVMLRKQIGARVREQRKQLQITQEVASERMDITPAHLGLIERGHRGLTYDKVVLVAQLLQCTPDYLFLGNENTAHQHLLYIVKDFLFTHKKPHAVKCHKSPQYRAFLGFLRMKFIFDWLGVRLIVGVVFRFLRVVGLFRFAISLALAVWHCLKPVPHHALPYL